MGEYREEEYLMLSGLQHFAFCKRQWALIHIENLWSDNYLTTQGDILHEKAHDSTKTEKRGNIITVRGIKVASRRLGVSGECDVVEFHKNSKGVQLKRWDGLFIPYPVEYKRGESKKLNCDRLQLCAQAMCLEEMLVCSIDKGALFYGETRRREVVEFTMDLRSEVEDLLLQMHQLYKKQHTPMVKSGKHCRACSLMEQCLPKLTMGKNVSVQRYLEDVCNEKIT